MICKSIRCVWVCVWGGEGMPACVGGYERVLVCACRCGAYAHVCLLVVCVFMRVCIDEHECSFAHISTFLPLIFSPHLPQFLSVVPSLAHLRVHSYSFTMLSLWIGDKRVTLLFLHYDCIFIRSRNIRKSLSCPLTLLSKGDKRVTFLFFIREPLSFIRERDWVTLLSPFDKRVTLSSPFVWYLWIVPFRVLSLRSYLSDNVCSCYL